MGGSALEGHAGGRASEAWFGGGYGGGSGINDINAILSAFGYGGCANIAEWAALNDKIREINATLEASGIGYRINDIALKNDNVEEIVRRFDVNRLFLDKSIVDTHVYENVKDYFIKNGNTKDTSSSKKSAFIVIRIYTNDTEQVFFLVEKQQITQFFNKLTQQVKEMSKGNENKDLLEMFANIVDGAF